jgi:DNA repair protein RadD
MLRDYQQRTINDLYSWLGTNSGHPCLVLPTGSGKSHIVAALCKDAVQNWPETTILMLTHVKELIEQNAQKMREHWPNAPLGIYSSGLRSKRLDQITFAGIQSIRNKAALIGHVDLVIIDECHLVSHKQEGGYRTMIDELMHINSKLRVIGLTATPYRLGHGLITDAPALFADLIEPVSIEELIYKGYLAPLRSKVTDLTLSTAGGHKRGGEYIESELQKAVDTVSQNVKIVRETIRLAGDRKAWLFFCTGVDHAYHIRDELREQGVTAETITGKTPAAERDDIIQRFKSGDIRALTNANVLTTGFDYPDIDLLVMARPTASVSLYVQMAGRGMRPKSHTDHCLVLDFAGVVQSHGPITAVDPGRKSGEGDAPVKVCENCDELVHISAKECPSCGEPFPEPEFKDDGAKLHNDDIMGLDALEMNVSSWSWRKHISRSSGKEMVAVSYYGTLTDDPIIEYLPITHEGYAGQKALRILGMIANAAGVDTNDASGIEDLTWLMNAGKPPSILKYKRDGKFYRVLSRDWE